MKKQSPVILLKAKGGKAFGALASLTDDSSLHLTWKVYSKVAEHLDQGQRIKNLSWRLWHLRDVMVTDEATSSSKSGKEVDVDQKSFNAMSASLANKLESDKKIPIDKLSAPEFRWTDSNDALRHKAIMRTKRRNASRKYVHSSTINKKAESKPKKDVVRNGNRENTHHSSLSPTTSTSSSSSSISFAPASRSSIVNRNNATTSRRTSSPPVCWRLTREQAIRQNKANGPLSEKSAGKQRQELKFTWTVQEIEDAERELKEQGVELSGPFLAMLTDLKTGELAKVNADEEEDVDDADESIMDDDDGDLEDSHDLIAKREDEEDSRINQNLSGISLPATPTGKSSSLARRISNAGTNEDSFLSNTSRPKPQCVNCGATKTPLWRRDANFELQCNACGLYEKLHKAPRPKALKQRRNEKRSRNDNSPEDVQRNGVFSNGLNSPQSEFNNNQKDEWMGIHAGASCANCGTSTTPLWRKDREGRIICNACGLYYKLHNSHRPVTMRMDAIKRRSRYDDRRRTGSIAGLSVAGTPNRINPDEELLSKIFEHGTSSMMIPNTMHPNTPDTPNSLIGNPFFQNGMPNPNQMPLQPFQIQPFHPNHAPNSLPLSAGLTNHHNEVTMTHSHSHPHSLHDGIHIPTELWENQVCPMGAWGENCCQNLPQPSSVDIQTALMATDSSNTPVTDQAAVTAAMDALLNHGDWMTDYGQNKPLSSSEEHMGSQAGTPASTNPNGITFDPAAVTSNSSHISPAIGPSVPLKRRKLNSTIIAGTAKSPINNTNPAPSPSTNNIPIPTPISTTAGSNAETPANDWWSFPGSPSIKQ